MGHPQVTAWEDESPRSLGQALVCLNCETVFFHFEADHLCRCPFCGSAATHWLKRWIGEMERNAA